nr:MAG TPA: hypothetical protein [Crassvirales sp.]
MARKIKESDILSIYRPLKWDYHPESSSFSVKKFDRVFWVTLKGSYVTLTVFEKTRSHFLKFKTEKEAKEMADSFIIEDIFNCLKLED